MPATGLSVGRNKHERGVCRRKSLGYDDVGSWRRGDGHRLVVLRQRDGVGGALTVSGDDVDDLQRAAVVIEPQVQWDRADPGLSHDLPHLRGDQRTVYLPQVDGDRVAGGRLPGDL